MLPNVWHLTFVGLCVLCWLMLVVLIDMLQQQAELRLKIAELEALDEEHRQRIADVSIAAKYWLEQLTSGHVYWSAPEPESTDELGTASGPESQEEQKP